jgi:hypothetical protein
MELKSNALICHLTANIIAGHLYELNSFLEKPNT